MIIHQTHSEFIPYRQKRIAFHINPTQSTPLNKTHTEKFSNSVLQLLKRPDAQVENPDQ